MTRTARRRWSREVVAVVDGIAFGPTGPVLLHLYDPPAGGMWIDDAIPGKLAAFDRSSGERLWVSPCEVGYGRGFGAGFGAEGEALVLGPSSAGHRIVRMSPSTGALMAAAEIPPFDEAVVAADVCLCVNAQGVRAIDSRGLVEVWRYAREGQRYHHIGREGERVFVTFSDKKNARWGLLRLDAHTGEPTGVVLAPRQPVVHGLAVDARGVVVVTEDLESALPPELLPDFLARRAEEGADDPADDASDDKSAWALLALDPGSDEGDAPLWYETIRQGPGEDVPEVAVAADSGKLYVVRGAYLEVRDALTGRALGEWTVPGLDERVAWQVSQGAGLLAEEKRVSVFELPA